MSNLIQTKIDFPVRKSSRCATPLKCKLLDKDLERLQLQTPAGKTGARVSEATTPASARRRTATSKSTRVKSAKKLFQVCDQENRTSPPKQRKLPADQAAARPVVSILDEAKQALNPAHVTDVKFRHNERVVVEKFLLTSLKEKRSGGLYIAGPPGTGKTLTVSRVIESLQSEFRFKSVLINCMGCRTPTDVYMRILTESGLKTPRKQKDCLDLVTEQIVTPVKGKRMTVLVFDEVDELESKNCDVLYTLFEWPQFTDSKVIVIGISNTLDFTKRSLKRFSSLKADAVETVSFQPYTKDQVKGILQSRLPYLSDGRLLVSDGALELCARKVSSLCGDIRKGLDVIRRAVELAELESQSSEQPGLRVTSDDGFNCSPRKRKSSAVSLTEPVAVRFVCKVLDEVYSSKAREVTSTDQGNSLPAQQQLTLCALLLLSKFSGKRDTTLSAAHRVFVKICNKKNSGSSAESAADFLNMCQLLEAKGFVSVKSGKETSLSKICLNVDEAEVEQVMSDKNLLRSILCDAALVAP